MTGKLYWIVCRRNLRGFAYLAPVHAAAKSFSSNATNLKESIQMS
jgi:hypothetical protein